MTGRTFPISIVWQIGNSQQVLSSVNQVGGAFNKLKGSATTAAGGVSNFGSSMQGTLPSLTGYNSAAQKAVGTSSAMSGSFGQVRNALGGMNSQVSSASKTFPQLTASQQMAAQSSTDLAAKSKATTAQMTQIGSKVGGLAFLFGGFTAAMGESAAMQENLQAQQEKLNEAQEAAALAIQTYGANSKEATEALREVEDAEKSVAFAGRIARLSYQDQIFYILSLSSLAIGPAVTAFGKFREAQVAAAQAGVPLITSLRNSGGAVGTLFNLLGRLTGSTGKATVALNTMPPVLRNVGITTTSARSGMGTFSGALTNLAPIATTATGATGKFSAALKGLGGALRILALNPILLPLTILSTILIAVSTNLFGFRDALNAAGKAIGDAIPGLRPLLEGIKSLGEAMGLAGEQTVSAAGEVSGSLQTMEKDGVTRIGGIIVTVNEFGQSIKDTLPAEVREGVDAVDADIQRLVNSLAILDSGLVPLGNSFTKLFTQDMKTGVDIVRGLNGELTAIDQGFRNNLTTVKTFNEVLPQFSAQFGELGNQIIIGKDANGVWTTTAGSMQVMANKLGISVEELSFLLNQAAKSSGDSDAQFKVIDGTLALVAGTTETVAVGFTNYSQKLKLAREEAIRTIPGFENLSKTTQDYIIQQKLAPPAIEETNTAMEKGFEVMKTGIDTTADLATRYEQWKATMDSTTPSIDELTGGVTEQERSIQLLNAVFDTLVPQLQKAGTAAGDLARPFKDLAPEFKATETAILSMVDGINKIITPTQILNGILVQQAAQTDNVNNLLKIYTGTLQAAGISVDQYISFLQEQKIIDSETADLLKEKAKALGLVTEETEKDTTAIQELTAANVEARNELLEWIAAMNDGTFVQEQMTAGTISAAEEQVKLAAEILNTRGELEFYSDEINLANDMQMQFIAGIEGVALQLIEQAEAFSKSKGEILGYVQALRTGVPQLLAFKEGQLEAEQAVLDLVLEISKANGEIQRYAQSLADGRRTSLEYKSGQQEILRSILDNIASISNLQGQIDALHATMNGAATIEFAKGLLEGSLAAEKLTIEIAKANGEWLGFRNNLLLTHPELQKFGDLSGFTNEQLQQMVEAVAGSREAIHTLVDELLTASGAFNDFVSSVDFREIDDEFEELVDKIREGTDEMIEIAEEEGVKVSDEFRAALDFEATKQAAAAQLQELWPALAKAIDVGMNSVNPNLLAEGIDVWIANAKHALEDGDLPGATKTVIQGILTEIENLKNIKDPVQLLQAMQNIKSKIDLLATGKDGLEQTTTALTNLTEVDPANFKTIAQEIEAMATAADTLQLSPQQIDAWAQSLSQLTGVPVDQLKAALERRLQETGASATSKLLEAGPGGDAARIAFGNQMVALAQIMSLFQQGVDLVISTVAADFQALTIVIGTETQKMGTHMFNLGTVLNTFAVEFMSAFAADIATNLTVAAEHFTNFGLVAGENLLASAQALNVFASEFMSAFAADIQTHLTASAEHFTTFGQQAGEHLFTLSEAMNTFAVDFLSAFASDVSSNLGQAVSGFSEFKSQAGSEIFSLSQALNTFASSFMSGFAADIGTHLRAASNHVKSFASSFSSAMSTVKSQASSASSAVKSLKSAIDSLKSKTITITVRYRTVGRPGLQHGGSFIANSPTMVAGRQIGEFSKPELVTVTPLTNPNDIQDKSINLNAGSVKRAITEDTSSKKKGRSLKKEVLEPIFVTIDGEVIMKLVQKRLLEFAADNII